MDGSRMAAGMVGSGARRARFRRAGREDWRAESESGVCGGRFGLVGAERVGISGEDRTSRGWR